MKQIKYITSLLIIVAFVSGCSVDKYEDLSSLSSITSPSKIEAVFDVTDDNSGDVTITPSGEAVGTFNIYFGDDAAADPATVQSGDKIVHKYAEGDYTVKIVGVALNGVKTEKTYPLSIVYRAPENLNVTFTKNVHNLKVKAEADYAASFLVYFGEDANEVGTPLEIGGEVEHDYAVAGNYTVKVVALSGGAAQTEQVTDVTMFDPYLLPIDFENPFVNYFFGTFGGGQQFSKEANPDPSGLNTSATVGKFRRGWEEWSGTYSRLDNPTAFDFSQGSKVKILVYTPDAVNIGKKLKLELEQGTISNGIAMLEVPLTTSGAWEELVFDFGPMLTDGTIPAGTTFPRFVLRFNRGTNGDFATIYIDDIRFTN
ncbi:hypothetical protein [Lutibacter sp.]|uniref:hypothetical protein n=1 Tax=Lutibacter sp. TaxID=1925666 RepID=UPI0025B7A8B9|nr:hypothetical protein [Lutibacter sp.]MCF6180629.1 hypothetical protein [Lutibacter sp.]